MNRKVVDGTRVYDIALRSLSNSIFSLKVGDVVYIADFNENVYIRPPIRIKDEHTKEVIYKIMVGIQPYGKWTFTYKMLEEVANLIRVSNISPKDSRVIIISDGIDDPPIKDKRYFANLEKLSTLFDPHQFIYYISLEKLVQKSSESDKGDTSISEKLKSTPQIVLIEAKDTNQVRVAVEKGFRGERVSIPVLVGITCLVVIIFLAALWLTFRYFYVPSKAKKASGVSRIVCSSARGKRSVALRSHKVVFVPSGRGIVLTGWTYSGKIVIKPTTKGYRVLFSLLSGVTGGIKSGDILKKGDTFSAGNYTFKAE